MYEGGWPNLHDFQNLDPEDEVGSEQITIDRVEEKETFAIVFTGIWRKIICPARFLNGNTIPIFIAGDTPDGNYVTNLPEMVRNIRGVEVNQCSLIKIYSEQ